MFPVFDVPNWVIRSIVVVIILGLPVALVLAWMFELTQQGIKRTETADAMPEATRKKKYVWIYVVVIGAAISIGLFFLGRYSAGNMTALPAGITNNLEDFFWRQRPYFYGALVACAVLSLFANLDYLKTSNAALFLKENLTVLPMFIPTVTGLVSRKRWVQWAAGPCYLAMMLGYTIAFCSTLS